MDQRRPRKSLKSLSRVILDASVILKTVLPDEEPTQKELALSLFEKYSQKAIDIIVPDFWVYEIGNTLSRKLKLKKAKLAFQFLLVQKFKVFRFSRLQLLAITTFSNKHKVSFYDASYHLLAQFTNSVFITADWKYFEKFKTDKNIVLLQSLKL